MTENNRRHTPSIDSDFLLTHLEYAAWAARKTIAMVDKLPTEAITRPVESSMSSILATLQHVYQWDKYYFIHWQGGSVKPREVDQPATYSELKAEWPKLHSEMLSWAKSNLQERKHVVLEGWGVWPLWMTVMQVASHGTHHLGQVLTLVRQAGYSPEQDEWTDLIFYYLRRYPQKDQKKWLETILED
jgi:uncharacterized damage-inducible protein DinB